MIIISICQHPLYFVVSGKNRVREHLLLISKFVIVM